MPKIRRIEIGFKLRESKLHNGMLFNSEAWSNGTVRDMERLEQVDTSALKHLMTGQSRSNKVFYYLEFGVLMIRHVVMMRRLIYHHHIINRDNDEIIKKIYQKQEMSPCKGDWALLIKKDFEFIGEQINQNFILNTSKKDYSKYIKNKVQSAAFESYLQLKGVSKKKMKDLNYDKLMIQNYLVSDQLCLEEKNLLASLRSMCYPAKMTFRKMHKGNLECSLQCDNDETQVHIFEACTPILSRLNIPHTVKIQDIYGSIDVQRSAVKIFRKIDSIRSNLLSYILPGEVVARTPACT